MASKDLKIHDLKVPWVSFGLVAGMFAVFLMEQQALGWGLAPYIFEDFSFRWDAFLERPWARFPTLFSYTFLHAGWDHLIFNMIFFLLFAPGVEEVMGRLAFLINFFLWGAAAALIHGFFWPFGGGLIGASGAVSGAAGAFFVFHPLRMPGRIPFPHSKLSTGPFRNTGLVFKSGVVLGKIPSFFWIGLWFLGELKSSFLSLVPETVASRVSLVAHGAHVGGFALGALSTLPALLKSGREIRR